MGISINNKESKVIIYDTINFDYANEDNIILLESNDTNDTINKVINIIANSIDLKDSEKLVYEVLSNHFNKDECIAGNINSINEEYFIKWITKDTNRSSITYNRAIHNLLVKGVIKHTNNGKDITITDWYNVTNLSNNATHIVIKVNSPKVNS